MLSAEEYKALVENSPRHAQDLLTVGYWTGMRKGELVNLTWDKVDVSERMIRLQARDTKERKPKSIPIGQAVYTVLNRIPRPIHGGRVFLYRGKPITHFWRALYTACKKANITWGQKVDGGFIFHDVRHTFVTDMRKAGVSKSVRMSITGHTARDMDARYDRVDDTDKHMAMRRLEEYRGNIDQIIDQRNISS